MINRLWHAGDHLLKPRLIAWRRLLGLLVGGRPLRFRVVLRPLRAVRHLLGCRQGHRGACAAEAPLQSHERFAANLCEASAGLPPLNSGFM